MHRESRIFDLEGKVAVVTGGGSGLGREFCDILSAFGADVICVDVSIHRAEGTCEMLKQYGHRALPVKADVSKYDQVRQLFESLEQSWGGIDILVNNAGIAAQSVDIHQIDIANWHKVIDVNLHGHFYCMREALRIMIAKGSGSVINIASIAGMNAMDPDILRIAPYVVSKAAIIGLTKQGAAEYGRYGIRVNCIAPGWHGGTKLAESAGITRTQEQIEELSLKQIAGTPMRRIGAPVELKGLLLYLASDASSFVTGQIIAHDGGWTCW